MNKMNLFTIIITIFYANCSIENLTKMFFGSNKLITYVFGHKNPDTDSIVSSIIMANFEEKMGNENRVIPCRLGEINRETEFVLSYFGANPPMLITKATEADEVILVDHNEPAQSAEDITKANIVKLIDHHGLSGFKSEKPIFIFTKPVGCTATVLYELYNIYGVEITGKIAGLMMSAIISDTILLKTSTTTAEDTSVVEKLSNFLKIDYKKYGVEMLLYGTNVSDYSEEKIINIDLKDYKVNGYSIQIAFLNSADVPTILLRKENLLNEMNKHIAKHKSQLFVFNILDILKMDSTVLVEGKISNVVEKAFKVTIEDHEAFLPGITSRKKEVYPYIAKVINGLQPYSYSSKIKIDLFLIFILLFMIL